MLTVRRDCELYVYVCAHGSDFHGMLRIGCLQHTRIVVLGRGKLEMRYIEEVSAWKGLHMRACWCIIFGGLVDKLLGVVGWCLGWMEVLAIGAKP